MIVKEILTKDINFDQIINPQIRDNAIFFDIETTGLAREHSSIFLCGVLYYDNSNYIIEQFFDETSMAERNLVSFISDHFKQKKYIVTYNGNAFDIPFYENKCKKYEVPPHLDKKTLVDLYVLIKKANLSNRLDNYKLKSIEKFMSLNRIDQLDGEDLIRLSTAYKITPKKEYLDLMLGHNREDIANLPYIHSYIDKNTMQNAVLLDKPSYNILHLIKKSLKVKRNSIRFTLTSMPVIDYDLIVNALLYKLLWSKQSAKVELELLVKEGFDNDEDYIKYINLKEYGLSKYEKYLILEKNHAIKTKNLLLLSRLLLEKHSS